MKLLCSIIFVMLSSALCFADEPDIAGLLTSVKDLSTKKSAAEAFSFRLQMQAEKESILQFDVGWLGDGEYSILLSEGISKVPIALITKEKFLFFDVVEGKIIVGTGLIPSLTLRVKESAKEAGVEFDFNVKTSTDSPAIDIGLRSFVPKDVKDCRFKDDASGATLSWPSPSKRTLTSVQFANVPSQNVAGFKLYSTRDELTTISVSSIKREKAVVYTQFPDLTAMPIEITEWKNEDNLESATELFQHMLRSLAGIAALANPESRKQGVFPQDVDWDLVKRRVNSIAIPLSLRLLPTNSESRQK